MESVWVAVLLGSALGGALCLLVVGLRGVRVDPTRPPARVARVPAALLSPALSARVLGGRRCVTEVREVVGSPDGRVASGLIFGPSPVDGRAVRAEEYGLTFERNKALEAAGYDDTARTFLFGGR